ncbi:MAG: bifunctional 4-hydroxy-2-oxoglutarate aldolase/2-dehydro-3-deoxy-phosphogluconate aldolase [Flavisolibacter sp.]
MKYAAQNMKGLYLGIGTIKTKKQAKKFIDEEADFIICPVVKEEIAELADEHDLLWIPGCMTPTEISMAEECNATIIKLFPGSLLGPSYVQSIKEIFPDLKFIPTGGVEPTENNLKEWFRSGVAAVGMGSKLISKELIMNEDFEGLTASVKRTLQLVNL